MIDKKELSHEISVIGYDILDNIISPTCRIKDILADFFLCDINTFTCADVVLSDSIILQIARKYQLPSLDEDIEMYFISPDMTLMNIIIYVILKGKY